MARKLNKKFVAGAVATVVVGAGGVGTLWFLRHPSVAKLEARGDVEDAAGDYHSAANDYGRASSQRPNDIPLQVKYLDAYDYAVQGDSQLYRNLRQMQAMILHNDPRSVPTLERVLVHVRNDVKANPADNPSVRDLAELASRLLQIEPDNVQAKKALITSVLEPYARNLDVPPEDVAKQQDAAQKLYDQNNNDGEALQMLVRFHLINAEHDAQQGDPKAFKAELTKLKTLVDTAVQKTPQNGVAWFAQSNTYKFLLQSQFDPSNRTAMIKTFNDSLTKANELTKPSDGEDFLTIRARALQAMEFTNVKQAEAGYRKLLDELPDNRQPRLMLADFLARQPSRRDDAIKVLETPWKPEHPLHSIEANQQKINAMIERVRLCTIKLGAMDGVTDPADREKRLADIKSSYAALSGDPDISANFKPALLRIQGGIDMEDGHLADAITALDNARKLIDPNSPYSVDQQTLNEVLMQYALVQLRLGQTGRAQPALTELVSRQPENLSARVALANLLIQDHNYDEAAKQMAVLTQLLPDNPTIQRMQVQLLAQRSDQLRDKYKDMPELTRDQRAIKLQAAGALGDTDEVTRLANLMVKTDPADVDAVNLLSQLDIRDNHREEAVALVNRALAAKPDDKRLKALSDNLAAQTPQEQTKLLQTRVDQITDPYQKALTEAQVEQSQGKTDDAIATLKGAEKLSPDDPRAPEARFGLEITAKHWDDADAMLDTLSRLNVDQTGGALRRIQVIVGRALNESDKAKQSALFKDALNKASDAAQKYSQIAAASLLYGQLLQQTGDYADAIEQFGQTLDKSPNNVDAIRGDAACLMQLGRSSEARSRLDDGEKIAPNDPGLYELELNYQLHYGDPLKAIAGLQDFLKKNPENPQAYMQLAGAMQQAAANKMRGGDPDSLKQAKQFQQQAADVFATAYQKFPDQLQFATELAAARRQVGDPTGAEQVFVQLAANPKYKDQPNIVEALSQQYVESGKIDAAEGVLKDLISRINPPPVSTVLRLSWLYGQQQKLQDAMAVLDLRKEDPDVQRQRIQLFIDANDLPQAHQAVDEAIAQHPGPDVYLSAAYLAIRDKKFDQASGFLNKVFESRPNDPAALFYRAQVKLAANPPDLDGARDDLIKTRDAAPTNVEARLALAEVYTRKRDPDSALGELQKAWDANRTSKLVLMRLADAYAHATPPAWSSVQRVIDEAKQSPQLANDPDVLFLEADTNVARSDTVAAESAAKQALALAPTNNAVRQRYFDVLVRAKAYQDVISESAPIIAADPSVWWLYRLRGIADAQMGQKDEAQKEFGKAYDIVAAGNNDQAMEAVARSIADQISTKAAIAKFQPLAATNDGARLVLADLYEIDGNPSDALDQAERVLADRSRLSQDELRRALQMSGNTYLQVSPPAPQKAIVAFQELLKQTPNDPLVLNNLAYALTLPGSGGTAADALKYSQKAFDLVANSGITDQVLYVWDTQGWVLVKNNRVDEGIDLLRKAAETATFPEVFAHLAEAYLMTNNLDGADLALTDARRRIDDNDRKKLPVDPTVRAKVEQLAADLAKKKTAAAAG